MCLRKKQLRLTGNPSLTGQGLCLHDRKLEMSEDSREDNVYMAKLAEQAERYDEASESLWLVAWMGFVIGAVRVCCVRCGATG